MPHSVSPPPNVHAHRPVLSRAERFATLRTRGCTVWFTGLSASGKSTIAAALEQELVRRKRFCYWLDGDIVRLGLGSDLGFSAEHRHENIRRIGEVSKLFADAGVIALTSFISPYRADRDRCRAMHERPASSPSAPFEPLPFLEVFVDTPLELCEQRDPKGLYKKARAGLITGFTGLDDPYEPPAKADLTLKTATMSVGECAQACLSLLAERGVIEHV